MHQVSLIRGNQEGLGMHRGTNLHNKINYCPVPMREDLETKISEKTTLMHGSMGATFAACALVEICLF
jgi:hypothetical protein